MNWIMYATEKIGTTIILSKTDKIENVPKALLRIGMIAICVEIETARGFARKLGNLIFLKSLKWKNRKLQFR